MTFAGYTVGQLRDFVRDLTGVYSPDLISDATIEAWINEAYFDLLAQQVWPWAPSVTEALAASSYPPFPGTQHRLLAYKAAAILLESQADDTQRVQEYTDVYTAMVAAVYQNTLNAASTGDVDTQAKIIRLVRELVDIFDNSITDTFISRKIDDEYNQLFDAYTWPLDRTSFKAVVLSNYGRILAYGVASRFATTYGKPEAMSTQFQNEYSSILTQMKIAYLYTAGAVTNPHSLGSIRTQVRALIQDYSKTLPDVLLNAWINEAYTNLSFEREWNWLLFDFEANLVTDQGSFIVPLTRRVLGMYNVSADGYNVKEVRRRAELIDIEKNNSTYYYEISNDLAMVDDGHGGFTPATAILIYPTPTEAVTFKGRAASRTVSLVVDSDVVRFDEQFSSILAYRVAIRALSFDSNNKKLLELYSMEDAKMFESMMRFYQLDASTDPFSIGSTALEQRKYIPYFRVS